MKMVVTFSNVFLTDRSEIQIRNIPPSVLLIENHSSLFSPESVEPSAPAINCICGCYLLLTL